jgi:hypothetical protein
MQVFKRRETDDPLPVVETPAPDPEAVARLVRTLCVGRAARPGGKRGDEAIITSSVPGASGRYPRRVRRR